MTVPASLAGLPAISVPAGSNDEGLPIGVQLIGNYQSDSNAEVGVRSGGCLMDGLLIALVVAALVVGALLVFLSIDITRTSKA